MSNKKNAPLQFKKPFMKEIQLMNPHTGKMEDRIMEGGFKELGNGLVATKHGTTTLDPHMVQFEVYNRSREAVFLEKMAPHFSGPQTIVCKGEEWTMVPHAYYIGKTASGAPYEFIVNYGKMKGIGNKKASRPE